MCMLSGRLTEVATEVDALSSWTPLVTVDATVWLPLDAKLLVGACKPVHPALFVVLNVIPQLLEAAVPVQSSQHARASGPHIQA